MYWYKVILGTRRYTTEIIEDVQADNAEQACNKAMNKHKRMRYAHARRVKG